jgi:hypothetical protein
MNILKTALIAGSCAAALAVCPGNLMAQGRPNFDPAEMKQRMMDGLRDQLEIKDDAEWTALEPKIGKVYDARRDMMAMGFGRGGFGGGMRRNNNNGDNGGDNPRPRRNNFFGEPSAAVQALEKAIEDKAPAAEIKTKLATVRAEWKDKQAKFQATQEELRALLTVRQEAILTLAGLLQ